jgi:hypothetical protein
MKRKRAYMVPVTYTIPVTIYYEEIAGSAREAQRLVKRRNFPKGFVCSGDQSSAFEREAHTELRDHYYIGGKVRVWAGEASSHFHSSKECKICAKVEAAPKRKAAQGWKARVLWFNPLKGYGEALADNGERVFLLSGSFRNYVPKPEDRIVIKRMRRAKEASGPVQAMDLYAYAATRDRARAGTRRRRQP